MTRIAFLGLGAMGSRMAANLSASGFDVTGWNRSPKVGLPLRVTSELSEAVRGAEIVVAMVTDDAASETVWTEALAAMKSGALAVESSTVSPRRMAGFAAEAEAAGVAPLAAPVAGSRPQAEAGELLFLTGGDADDAARFAPAVDAMGKAAIHAGTPAQAASLKLMINGLLAIQTAAMGEILKFGESAGFDAAGAVDLLAPVPVTSPAAAFVGKQIAAGQHDPMFTIELMAKDLGYLTKGADMPVLSEVLASFARAQNAGKGSLHISAVA